jgi:hypothetical protein
MVRRNASSAIRARRMKKKASGPNTSTLAGVWWDAGDFGNRAARYGMTSTRPLPPHFWQRAGYILRFGAAGCLTGWNPVPSQAGHIRSFSFSGNLGIPQG